MKFNPLTHSLSKNHVLFVKDGKLHIEGKSTVKNWLRRVFCRKCYSQNAIFEIFKNLYQKLDITNINEISKLYSNYHCAITKSIKRKGDFESSSKIGQLFRKVLHGVEYYSIDKSTISFFQNTVEKNFHSAIEPIKQEADFLNSRSDSFYSLIVALRFMQYHYIPFLFDKTYDAKMDELIVYLKLITNDLDRYEDELKEVEKFLQDSENFLEKSSKRIALIKCYIGICYLDEKDSDDIFNNLNIFPELNISYLSDFIKKLNSYLREKLPVPSGTNDSISQYPKVLEAAGLLYIKDYKAKNIYSCTAFDKYIKDNAQAISERIRYLL